MALAPIGPTTETTYALQLNHGTLASPVWVWVSGAEYTSPRDCEHTVCDMYGGAYSTLGAHRILRIDRNPLCLAYNEDGETCIALAGHEGGHVV